MQQHLFTLLLRLAVVASIASVLVRFRGFRDLLVNEDRNPQERLRLAGWFSATFATSIAIRTSSHFYDALDLGLEGSLLAGLTGGYLTGLLSGIVISAPAMLKGEFLSLPFYGLIGVTGGLLRDLATDKEAIWRFSPFFDLYLYRALRRKGDYPTALYHLLLIGAVIAAELLRQLLGHFFNGHNVRIFSLYPTWSDPQVWSVLAVYASTVLAVTLPLKVWNNARSEQKLAAQERLLIEARLEALTRQINPHFLFNTLNSVSSLIRTDPERARVVVLKLSRILRRLLRKHENLTAVRDELEFIDDYVAIESVRFGEKLRFKRTVEAGALDVLVPSMLLQPLIENSVKHGLSSKVEGGWIRLDIHCHHGRLFLSVEDDGVGISAEKMERLFDDGIGVSNVQSRLKVLYGEDYSMDIESQAGQGTKITIELPESQPLLAG